jgi:hypothetical protein
VVYEYVLNYLAHMIQRPEYKPGVMLVLTGGQGTGKGTFFKLLSAIWSKTSLCTNQIDQITGKFNNVLERYFIIWLDEALFVGNRNATDKLKSLITESQITIEEKNQSPRSIFSCHRLIAATNAEHFAHIDPDDRRMLYLPLPKTYQGKTACWKEINDALESTELDAFVHHLRNRDITGFLPSQRPVSHALVEQKLQSLTGFEAYWHDLLQSGSSRTAGGIYGHNIDIIKPIFIASTNIIESSEYYFKRTGQHRKSISERDMKARLQTICPSATHKRVQTGGIQSRGYDLPGIAQMRQDFERFIGGNIIWPL